jgi:hypothetical protein
VRIALVVIAAVIALTVAELTSEGFSEFTQEHALISTFITEGVLLVGVYLVIDEIIGRREARRWSDVTSLGIRALSVLAKGPAEIIRESVDELGIETSGTADVDYEAVVSARADELGDWLRADAARARPFADEMRRSASRLEEAIIRWGPTLVEDPDSAELLNLLPDVVDSTRSAAQAIAPAPRWLDPVGKEGAAGSAPASTEDDRQRFRDCLLEILRNVREFDRRRSSQD